MARKAWAIRYNGGKFPQWVQQIDDSGVQMTPYILGIKEFETEKECRNTIAMLTIGYGIGDLQPSMFTDKP